MPDWLYSTAWIFLALGILCAGIIAIDIIAGHRQRMWIMNLVWPVTGLYAGPIALFAYFKLGRISGEKSSHAGNNKPFWQSVALGAMHCGSGCTLGDIVAESFLFFVPLEIMGRRIFAAWTIDYALAFLFGIIFQYFTIQPMRQSGFAESLKAALKADTLSLTAWQIGMYGWMAIIVFLIVNHEIPKNNPIFWFMMQIAMLLGFLTSYPVNWWLLQKGIKERM